MNKTKMRLLFAATAVVLLTVEFAIAFYASGMIQFLRSKGYTVLNMIEIRKPYAGEKLTTTIRVGTEDFDY